MIKSKKILKTAKIQKMVNLILRLINNKMK